EGEITVHHDPRVTQVGRILRATKLDELPQLINVLRGEMSLVGPRPESPYFVAYYTEQQKEVLRVRPGITGAAQLVYCHEEELLTASDPEQQYLDVIMPAKLAIDLNYVRQHSFWLDIQILLSTFVVLVPLPALRRPGSKIQRAFSLIVLRRLRLYGLSVLLDILCVACAFEMSTVLRFIDTADMTRELARLSPLNVLVGCLYATIAYAMGLHRSLWRYAGMRDGLALLLALGVTVGITSVADLFPFADERLFPISIIIGGALSAFLFVGCAKVAPRVLQVGLSLRSRGTLRVLIVGAGQAGAALAARFLLNSAYGYQVLAFVDDDPEKQRRSLHGRPILGMTSDIPTVVQKCEIDVIAIALPTVRAERIGEIVAICQRTPARIKIMQGLHEMIGQRSHSLLLREVNVADLLGREVIPLQTAEAKKALAGKTVLVTGAAGSIGAELCRQVIGYAPAAVLALDNNETGLFELQEDLRSNSDAAVLSIHIGDITNSQSMERFLREKRPHIIFHAAAYKHVPLLEAHPDFAIHTNVLGTWCLCQLAQRHAVERFIFISSDKAAEPVNVLGASKRAGELLMQVLAQARQGPTTFCSVRFGNVIGSRGSVVPTFTRQIEQGGPVTVTDPEATRYFMTIPEACGLVVHSATMAKNGELFLLDMGEPVRIVDLAEKMIRLRGLRVQHDIAVIYTGLRPGERLHERLTAHDERLVPTANSKIFHIVQEGETPTLDQIEQWMQNVQEILAEGNLPLLREQLFAIVREPVGV
ncbi:MAG: SDR family NAD(P)-dependent oxidoreductase, partial [Chloroflexota bacterium]|nr:SDR family NAD(P)-dependent oxidoreductase [Chloroflexota bacterium]